jgi:hypothetical protein
MSHEIERSSIRLKLWQQIIQSSPRIIRRLTGQNRSPIDSSGMEIAFDWLGLYRQNQQTSGRRFVARQRAPPPGKVGHGQRCRAWRDDDAHDRMADRRSSIRHREGDASRPNGHARRHRRRFRFPASRQRPMDHRPHVARGRRPRLKNPWTFRPPSRDTLTRGASQSVARLRTGSRELATTRSCGAAGLSYLQIGRPIVELDWNEHACFGF